MRNIVFIIILMVMLPMATQAKGKSPIPDVRKHKTELQLTTEQMNRLNTLYTNFEARAKLQAPAENRKEQLLQKMELNKEMRKEVLKVLTPKQRKAYFQLIQSKRAQQKIK
ncbi:MAG: hypothetical protein K9H26_06215 [Prolixibacteraceae bacterium]|nr:hypothetical protein [Prolixibacteraceae bacterium]